MFRADRHHFPRSTWRWLSNGEHGWALAVEARCRDELVVLSSRTLISPNSAERLDDDLVDTTDGGTPVVSCRHRAEVLGETAVAAAELAFAHEGPATSAGPQIIANAACCIDRPST
ncbi:hypothetical protein DI005_22860 [Prauserella sp. PE36]|uniref:hypothetical protein n=1 Tax=Prauserella sp. PE36 TaxID=1504709 RepID=UPI000DE24A53|nr:hypothetical protein [Prauserella sp. PE36]RBM17137.1 hypothetical protein DI005_22860 [Prauserella sp. PE36]